MYLNLNLNALQKQIKTKPLKEVIPLFRNLLKESQAIFREAFQKGAPILDLLQGQAALVDFVLKETWNLQPSPPTSNYSLIAVGGYGRRELHPRSDIDLLLLFAEEGDKELAKPHIETWLATIWDCGLEVGHGVRTTEECVNNCARDVTIATNLMEARLLLGSNSLFDEMKAKTSVPAIWPIKTYFDEKHKEQQKRHKQYHDTAYNLEPNIKGTPGGLRDLQTVEWIATRYFRTSSWLEWVRQGFLLETECQALLQAREFLWRVRFVLHTLARRREDRLLFDYQRQVAAHLGYEDTPNHLAVEQLMKKYYQTVMEVQILNELLLQVFKETFGKEERKITKAISPFLSITDALLIITAEEKFALNSKHLFELFILLAKHHENYNLSASTIRLLRATGRQLKPYQEQSIKIRTLFLTLLKNSRGVSRSLRFMKQSGILGAYLPELAHVTGQMQYDLFHVYTVDEHTLFVIERICSFYQDKHQERFPLCNPLAKKIQKPELLIIAALFHDIAKGQGGDHSWLGAKKAEQFCIAHGLASSDTQLVSWLVAHHLLLSMTAQKKDLSDPLVIVDFANKVLDQTRLNYLYLLTVADISATNPQLWNTWRASLIRDLFETTSAYLQKGLIGIEKMGKAIGELKEDAWALLKQRGVLRQEVENIWTFWEEDFFLRLSPQDIAWQTEAICRHKVSEEPLVLIQDSTAHGTTEIFVYCNDRDYLFATITTVLASLDLSIVDAQIMGDAANHILDTFFVLENSGEPVKQVERFSEIKQALLDQLRFNDRCLLRPHQPLPRRIRHFSWPTTVQFELAPGQQKTILELTTLDKPGLLAKVGQVFFDCGVILHRAKISTIGEKVEDVFYITTQTRKILSKALEQKLKQKLIDVLDEN